MSDRAGPRRVLIAGCAALVAAAAAVAADTKVPNAGEIRKAVEKLYNLEIPYDSASGREKQYLEIEKHMSKDKAATAMKRPDFWVDAIQEGRFTGTKRHMAKKNALVGEEIVLRTVEANRTTKPKVWYRGGGLVNAAKPCPILVCILPRGGDAKAYLEATWVPEKLPEPAAGAPAPAVADIVKNWVVAAVVADDSFPVGSDPGVLGSLFFELRERYNLDGNRWYLEASGAACEDVQTTLTQSIMAQRLAGLVLRGPTKAIVNENNSLYPTLVVHGKTSAEGAKVVETYKKLSGQNDAIVVDDLPQVTAMSDAVIGWFEKHPKRTLPSSYSWTTTFTDTQMDPWTGTMIIEAPIKRGIPIKLAVKYLKDSNTVDIQAENLGECTVCMNDDLLDLDKEVTIFANGNQAAKRKMDRRLRDLFDIADFYSGADWGRVFTSTQRIVVQNKIAAPPPAQPAPPAGQPANPANPPVPDGGAQPPKDGGGAAPGPTPPPDEKK
jgi:hypothetical protein